MHFLEVLVFTNAEKLEIECTVNFLNIWTPKKFVVITQKFELCGSTIEQ